MTYGLNGIFYLASFYSKNKKMTLDSDHVGKDTEGSFKIRQFSD